MKNSEEKVLKENDKPECFVIMPIGERAEYEDNHFKKIYEQIIKPAVRQAGFEPKRADDSSACESIHAQIIMSIMNAPMAVCDLSTKNPNVLYELGLRQALGLPVVLINERGTEKIFDIAGLNTVDYRKDRLYDEVLEDIDLISKAIMETNRINVLTIYNLISIAKPNTESNTRRNISDKEMNQALLLGIMDKINCLQDSICRREDETSLKRENKYLEQIRYLGNIKTIIRKGESTDSIMYELSQKRKGARILLDRIESDSLLSEKEKNLLIVKVKYLLHNLKEDDTIIEDINVVADGVQ